MGRPAKATVRQHDSWGGGPGAGKWVSQEPQDQHGS